MKITLNRINDDYLFECTNSLGNTILLNSVSQSENKEGVSPMETILMAVAGCSGIDMISILKKQRQEITKFSAEVEGERVEVDEAKPFKTILVKFFLEGKIDAIKASHDGYKKDGVIHTRIWNFKEKKLIIKDELSKKANAIARLHFHPNITKENIIEKIICNNKIIFSTYDYAPKFNTLEKAIMIEISFEKNLELEIQL